MAIASVYRAVGLLAAAAGRPGSAARPAPVSLPFTGWATLREPLSPQLKNGKDDNKHKEPSPRGCCEDKKCLRSPRKVQETGN